MAKLFLTPFFLEYGKQVNQLKDKLYNKVRQHLLANEHNRNVDAMKGFHLENFNDRPHSRCSVSVRIMNAITGFSIQFNLKLVNMAILSVELYNSNLALRTFGYKLDTQAVWCTEDSVR